MKNKDQWFLEGFLRQYKLGKILPKFEDILRRNNAWKRTKTVKLTLDNPKSIFYRLSHTIHGIQVENTPYQPTSHVNTLNSETWRREQIDKSLLPQETF